MEQCPVWVLVHVWQVRKWATGQNIERGPAEKKRTPKPISSLTPRKVRTPESSTRVLTWNSVQFESWYMYDRLENERQVKISKGAQQKKKRTPKPISSLTPRKVRDSREFHKGFNMEQCPVWVLVHVWQVRKWATGHNIEKGPTEKKGTPKEFHPWPPEKAGIQRVPQGFLTWNSVQFEFWYMLYDRFENERRAKTSKGAQQKKGTPTNFHPLPPECNQRPVAFWHSIFTLDIQDKMLDWGHAGFYTWSAIFIFFPFLPNLIECSLQWASLAYG